MGLNAYFTYTVCGQMGYDWKVALAAVAAEGVIFIILSVTNVREAIFNVIPSSLKKGVGVGIGLFVAFVGLQGAHIIVDSPSTLLTYVGFRSEFHTAGICAILALIGLIITAVLYIKHVKGSILIGILITWILGMLSQAAGLYHVTPDAGYYSLYPKLGVTDLSAFGKTFGQVFHADFGNVKIFDFVVILFSFLFVDMFDTIGTLVGVATKADMLDENEKLPRIKSALLADAIATLVGAVFARHLFCSGFYSNSGICNGTCPGFYRIFDGNGSSGY